MNDDVIVSSSPPRNPATGDLWFNPSSDVMKIYYDSTWVEVANSPAQGALNDEERDELERLRLREQLRLQQR